MFKRVAEYKVTNWFEDEMLQFKLRRFGKKNFIRYKIENVMPTLWSKIYFLDENTGLLVVQYTKVIE